jgi:hypothetical protein
MPWPLGIVVHDRDALDVTVRPFQLFTCKLFKAVMMWNLLMQACTSELVACLVTKKQM